LDKQALALVKTQYRRALPAFGEAPIMALTRRLSPGACSWCACRILCAAGDTPLPKPTAGLRALLGSQCSRCKVAFDVPAIAEQEDAYVRSLEAAGYAAEDAAFQRPMEPRATGTIRATPGASHPHYYQPKSRR
jgi:hypothetical protein